MNKSKILFAPAALLMAGMLLFSGCGKSMPVTQPEEPSAEEPVKTVRAIGEDSENAYSVNLTNGTGKNIIALSVLSSDSDSEESSVDAEPLNLLEGEKPITADEQFNLLYAPADADTEIDAEPSDVSDEDAQPEEKELTTEYTVHFKTDDEKEYDLHAFPFEDLKDGLILLSAGDVAYMEYSSQTNGEWVNTLEAEIATAEQLKAAEEEAAQKAAEEAEAAKKAAEEKAKAEEQNQEKSNANNQQKKKQNSGGSSNRPSQSETPGVVDDPVPDDGGSSDGGGSSDDGGSSDGGDDGCVEDGLTW